MLKILGVAWGVFLLLIVVTYLCQPMLKPVVLEKDDIYGKYRVDKTKYSGRQADWQHDHHLIEINSNDTLTLYIFDDNGHTIKEEKVKISFNEGWVNAPRIVIHSDLTSNHIIKSSPTLYRKRFFNFYYVFESELYGNMFFKKE